MNCLFLGLFQSMGFLSVFAAVFLTFIPQSMATEVDPLWQKAITIAAANDGLIPEKIIEESKAYRTEDKIDQHTISHFQIYTDKDRKLQVRVLNSIRNGKDFTKDKQKEIDQQKENQLSAREDNIFLPENQDTITVKRTGRKKTIKGHACIAMEYTKTLPESTEKGIVWLDEATGVPYKLTANPKKLPDIKKINIKNAYVELDYTCSEDGKWVLETLTFTAKVELKFFIFFTYKGNYQVVSAFKDYKRMDFKR